VTALGVDLIVCTLLLATAVAAVLERDLLAEVVFFIAFGIILTIAWIRLGAVDLALAEAAIGAGLMGFLLLNAVGHLRRLEVPAKWEPIGLSELATAVATGAVALMVGWAVLSLDLGDAGLQVPAAESAAELGIENAVTAILLDDRAFDTLLESIVLVASLICVWAVTDEGFWGGRPGPAQRVCPHGVLATSARFFPQAGLAFGVYLVWAGTSSPGGAFQGGTMLAALWLVSILAGLVEPPRVTSTAARLAVIAGPAIFLGSGVLGALGGEVMAVPPSHAWIVILAIELGLAASVATILMLLVLGPPERGAP